MHNPRGEQNGLAPMLLALALVAGTAAVATAMPGAGQGSDRGPRQGQHEGMKQGGGMQGCGMGMGMGMGLDLTAEQRDKLKDDRLARGKRLIALKAEAQTLKLDLREAESVEKLDLGKVESLANKLGQVKAKMIVERAKGRQFLLGLLTAEQKKNLAAGCGHGQGPWGAGPRSRGDGPDDED